MTNTFDQVWKKEKKTFFMLRRILNYSPHSVFHSLLLAISLPPYHSYMILIFSPSIFFLCLERERERGYLLCEEMKFQLEKVTL